VGAWTVNALLEALDDCGLASTSAIRSMRQSLQAGRFDLAHYVRMWEERVAEARAEGRDMYDRSGSSEGEGDDSGIMHLRDWQVTVHPRAGIRGHGLLTPRG
jgi:hypothetical protein